MRSIGFTLILIISVVATLNLPVPVATLTLTQSPDLVHSHVTKSVNLECSDTQSKNVRVTRIRILKLEAGTWTVFAQLGDNDQCVSTDRGGDEPGVSLSGYVGSAGESYLRITWMPANEKTFGRYRCDAVLINSDQELILQTTSQLFLVDGNLVASDVVGMIQEVEASFKKKMDSQRFYVDSAFTNLMKKLDLFTDELKNIRQGQQQLLRHLDDKMHDVNPTQRSKPSDTPMENFKSNLSVPAEKRPDLKLQVEVDNESNGTAVLKAENWPSGTYGLLMPHSGCPANTSKFTWLEVTQKHPIKPENDSHFLNLSSPSHISLPLVETKEAATVMYERLCQVHKHLDSNNSIADETTWPQGSYCINRGEDPTDGGRSSCPERFQPGYIRIEESYDITQTFLFSKLFNVKETDGRSTLDFCCRDEWYVPNRLNLPTSSPFYLYRYRRDCPQVYGMRLVEEYLHLDIGREGTNWKYDNARHPDMSDQGFTLQLCYYTRT